MSVVRSIFWIAVSFAFGAIAFIVVGGITLAGLALILIDLLRPRRSHSHHSPDPYDNA